MQSESDIRYMAACCLDIVRPQAEGKRIALLLDVAKNVPARAMLESIIMVREGIDIERAALAE